MAAYAIQFRRGTTTQHSSFTGLVGEVTVDTDKKTLVVHDGSTTGGYPLAREGAAASMTTGNFSSNVSVGGTLSVTNLLTASGGIALTGDLTATGHIIPSADNTYDLGTSSAAWRDMYVGPGSLYVNNKKIVEDDSGTITIKTDINETLKMMTTGTGTLQIESANGIQFTGELKTSSGDLQVGDHLDLNSNLIKEVGTPVSDTDAANKAYVDSAVTGGLGSGSNPISATTGSFSSDVDISGNLTVTGTTTTINTSQINLADNILLLNSDATGTASANAGIEVERGDDLNVQFLWDETNDRWSVGAENIYTSGSFVGALSGNVTGNVTGTVSDISNHDTDSMAEGSSNLYHTAARARAAISGAGDILYDNTTGVISINGLTAFDTDDVSEGANNLYYTTARWDTKMAAATSDDLSEGSTNLYFTNARAISALSGTDTDAVAEGSTNLYYTDARVGSYLTSNSYATEAFVTSAVSGVDNSDEITEGSTNLFFTNERAQDAVMANVSGGTGISVSYDDAAGTLTVTNTQTEVNDYVDGASFSGGTLTLSVGTQSDVTVSLDGRYAKLGDTTKKHSHAYEVSSTDESTNSGASYSRTWAQMMAQKVDLGSGAVDMAAEIAESPYAVVYINRIMARPNEVEITATGLTFAADVLSEDDEVEVIYMDEQ